MEFDNQIQQVMNQLEECFRDLKSQNIRGKISLDRMFSNELVVVVKDVGKFVFYEDRSSQLLVLYCPNFGVISFEWNVK